MKKEPDDEMCEILFELGIKLGEQSRTGKVNPEDRKRYEDLCEEYAWGEHLSEDD